MLHYPDFCESGYPGRPGYPESGYRDPSVFDLFNCENVVNAVIKVKENEIDKSDYCKIIITVNGKLAFTWKSSLKSGSVSFIALITSPLTI